jgi:hypothetical protein
LSREDVECLSKDFDARELAKSNVERKVWVVKKKMGVVE